MVVSFLLLNLVTTITFELTDPSVALPGCGLTTIIKDTDMEGNDCECITISY